MKLLARILLFIFIAFLSTPTIVQALKKSNGVTITVNFSEEEQAHKELKDLFVSKKKRLYLKIL